MTQEDPPEYVIRGAKQVCVVTSSSEKARKEELVDSIAGLVRSDPDVIMIGEIRYREMAEAAINAALTGHGVWTTLHASSAFGILIRLREMGVPLEDMCADGVLTALFINGCCRSYARIAENPSLLTKRPFRIVCGIVWDAFIGKTNSKASMYGKNRDAPNAGGWVLSASKLPPKLFRSTGPYLIS